MSDPWREERRGTTTTFELDAFLLVECERADAPTSRFDIRAVMAPVFLLMVGLVGFRGWGTLPLVVIAFALLAALNLLLHARAKAQPRRTRWHVKVEPGAVSIVGIGAPILVEPTAIDRFEATAQSIELLRADGTRHVLPFVLGDAESDRALAVRLSEVLVALRTGGGYRGLEPEEAEPRAGDVRST